MTRLSARERAAIAEEVASSVRHDLRNKLASVRNAAFYIKRRAQKTDLLQVDPRVEMFFKLIEDELGLAETILAGRLMSEPAVEAPRSPTSLAACTADALEAARVPQGIEVSLSAEGRCEVPSDPLELVLMVRCLVDNAVEAMPNGGQLTIGIKETAGRIELRLADHGTGMSAETRARAFECYFSTKQGHAGLGLNMVKRIAERYSGKVAFQESVEGTIVQVSLPCTETVAP
jgi:signal transduction histidine kinase